MPFGIDSGSIFGPNLPPKIHQNRWKIDAKMPSHVDLLFGIDFWSIFAPNLDPPNPNFRAPAAARARFSKKPFFAIGIDFRSIFVPTCLQLPSQNPPKSHQKSMSKAIDFSIDVRIFFYRFWFDFAFQLGSENPPKSMTNRCRDAFPCWPFLIDFWWVLAANLWPRKPTKI